VPHRLALLAANLRSVLLCFVAALGGGRCSFIFVRPLPPAAADSGQRDATRCTDATAPAGDVVLVIPSAILTGAAVAETSCSGIVCSKEEAPYLIAGFGLLTLAFASSALYGFAKTNECQVAKQQALVGAGEPDDFTFARVSNASEPAFARASWPAPPPAALEEQPSKRTEE